MPGGIDMSNTHLSDIDFAILIVIVGLHEAGLQLLEHGVRDSLGVLHNNKTRED